MYSTVQWHRILHAKYLNIKKKNNLYGPAHFFGTKMPNSARRLCSSKPCPESGAIECGLVMWALRSRRRMDSQWMCPVVFTASSQTWGPPKHSESLKHLEMERPLRDLHGLWSTECYSCTWMFSYVFIIFFHIFSTSVQVFLVFVTAISQAEQSAAEIALKQISEV